MKAGITLLVATLALAVFAAACDRTKTSEERTKAEVATVAVKSLNLTLEGKSTPTNPNHDVAERKWDHALAAVTASGQSVGTLTGDSAFKRHKKFRNEPAADELSQPIPSDPRCSNAPDTVDQKGKTFKRKWGSDLQKVEWTLTYDDGSTSGTLAGKATNPTDKPVCTDGNDFYVEVEGKIQNGSGDFQGASGTWKGKMTVLHYKCESSGCPTKGTLNVELD